jgi:predicted transposase YbfD/YdcC
MLTTPLALSLDRPAPASCTVPTAVPQAVPDLPSLYTYLAQVPDPRDPRGVRHPLPAVLSLVCCGLLCGARHLVAIAEWGRNHPPDLIVALGFTRPKTPACSTLHYLLGDLDWRALETQLRAWVQAVEASWGEETPAREEAWAIDGKTLRGALKLGAEVTALVTALGHRLGLTAGAVAVEAGDEIAAVQTLLSQLVLGGQVVTLDALHTQRKTARIIGAQGGHYLMTVKGNQPDLQEAVVALFAPERAWEQDRESVETTETGHGRVEHRWLQALSIPADAPAVLAHWPGAAQVFVVERRVWKRKQRVGHRELVYGITSLTREQAGPAALLRLNRGHWQIETRSHYIRDVTFGEDASTVRTGKIPQVLALFRAAVISRFRADGVTNIAQETRRLAAQARDCLRLLGLAHDN